MFSFKAPGMKRLAAQQAREVGNKITKQTPLAREEPGDAKDLGNQALSQSEDVKEIPKRRTKRPASRQRLDN